MANNLTDLVLRDFELASEEESPSDEEIFHLLCDRIAYMIEHQMEYLLSLLYRNDVEESKINFALSPLAPEPPNVGLARLVIERQKQRLATKKMYGSQHSEEVDEDSRW